MFNEDFANTFSLDAYLTEILMFQRILMLYT